MKPITKGDICAALKDVGVHTGQTLMVHTSLSKIEYVCGGAQTVIEAQIEIKTPFLIQIATPQTKCVQGWLNCA